MQEDASTSTPRSVLDRIRVFEAAGGAVTLNLTADDWVVIKASLGAVDAAERRMRDRMLSQVVERMRRDRKWTGVVGFCWPVLLALSALYAALAVLQ